MELKKGQRDCGFQKPRFRKGKRDCGLAWDAEDIRRHAPPETSTTFDVQASLGAEFASGEVETFCYDGEDQILSNRRVEARSYQNGRDSKHI